MSHLVDIKIQLDQTEPFIKGEKLSGKIIVEPKENLDVEKFTYQVIYEQRGLVVTEEKNIKHTTTLDRNKQFLEDKIYVFLIHFNTLDHITYKGKNIELLIKIEATLKLKNNLSTNKILSKIGYISQGETIYATRYIKVKSKEGDYQLVNNQVNLASNNLLKYALFILITPILIGAIYFSSDLLQKYKDISVYIGFSLICIVILYGLLEFILIGEVHAKLKDLKDHQFQVNLNNDLNWKFTKKTMTNFSISEEVIDRRGTSDTSNTFKIHSSKIHESINPTEDISINFDYPKDILATYKTNDLRIFWSIELKIISLLGIPFHLRSEFEVERKNSTLSE